MKMSEMWRRLRALFGVRGIDHDLEREMQFHLDMAAEDFGPDAARRSLGSSLAWREQARDAWGWRFLDEFARDVRYAVRGLGRSKGFAAAAILTLALAIGANTLMFSVADATVLREFPFPDPDRLVLLWTTTPRSGLNYTRIPVYEALKNSSVPLELAGSLGSRFTVGENPYPETVPGEYITANYLDVLGIKPVLGRSFRPEEQQAGGPDVALISQRFWRDRFSSDPSIVGRTIPIRLSGERRLFTIVGIAPPELQTLSPNPYDVWLPLQFTTEARQRGISIIGRLEENVSIATADAAVDSVYQAGQTKQGAETATGTLTPLRDIASSTKSGISMLSIAVGVVLLIGCVGVANLMLARGAERTRELSIRTAVGAGRGRLIRQLLTESVVLAAVAGVLGAGLAFASVRFVIALIPLTTLRRDLVAVDLRSLAFTVAVSLLASVLFGLIPAWRASRTDLRPVLGETHGGRVRTWLRSSLIVVEVALTLVLMTGAGLLLKTFFQLAWKEMGFVQQDLLTLSTGIPMSVFNDPPARVALEKEVERRLAGLPGVEHVGFSDTRPLGNAGMYVMGRRLGQTEPSQITWSAASPGFREAMGLPLLQGRFFSDSDTLTSDPVVILSDSAAKALFPDASPLGQKLIVEKAGDETPRTIVGIVGNSAGMRIDREQPPLVYVPHAQDTAASVLEIVLRVRPDVSAASLGPAIRTQLASVDRSMAAAAITPMGDVVSERLSSRRFLAVVTALFAGLGLLLTVTAVSGVAAYLVRARTYEFGVRMALGATRAQVMRLVVAYGGWLALAGIAIGGIGSWMVAGLMESFLYHVEPHDPAALVSAPLLLLVAVLVACYVPARRAMAIDPARALRHD